MNMSATVPNNIEKVFILITCEVKLC